MGNLLKLHHKNVINLPSCLNQEEISNKDSSVLSQTGSTKYKISIKELILGLGVETQDNLKKKGFVTRSFQEPLGISPGTVTKIINAKNGEGSNDIQLGTYLKMSNSQGIGISTLLTKEFKSDDILTSSSLKADTLSQSKNQVRSYPERALNLFLSAKPWLLTIYKPNQFRIRSFERPLKVKNGHDLRVDMSGVDDVRKVEVLIETQTTTMDDIHYRQLKRRIENSDEVDVIWIAPKAVHKYFKKLVAFVKGLNKNINLYFIEFNPTFLPVLRQLDGMSELDAHKATMQADFINPIFKVRYQFTSMSNNFKGSFKEPSSTGNAQTDNYNLLILNLKERLGYYSSIMSCHYKEGGNHIRIAAGLKEIDVFISLPSAQSKGTNIKIQSPDKKSARTSFDEIKPDLFEIQFSADLTEVNDTTLVIDYESDNSFETSLDSIVKDIEKLLHAFSDYRISLKKQPSK